MNKAKPEDGKNDREKKASSDLEQFQDRVERDIRKPKFLLQIAGLLVLGLYTTFTYLLWHDANHNFAASQRPWVGINNAVIEQFFENGDYVIAATVSNSGKEPAFRTWYWNKSRLAPDAGLGDRSNMDDGRKHAFIGSLPPGGPRNMRIAWKWDQWKQGYPYLTHQKATISNYGEIVYYDGDGNEHRTQFCFFLKDVGLPTQRIDYCSEFNEMW